jgi:hypothetical protein
MLAHPDKLSGAIAMTRGIFTLKRAADSFEGGGERSIAIGLGLFEFRL